MLRRGRFMRFIMLTDEHGKDGGEEHENQRLDEADEQFHEIKGNGQKPAEAGDEFGHGFEHVFAGENVAVKPEAEGDGAEEDGKNLEQTDGKEDDDHEGFESAGAFAFGGEEVAEEAEGADF